MSVLRVAFEPLAVGAHVGSLVLERRLTATARTATYAARDEATGRAVVAKVFGELGGLKSRVLARLREIELLDHPGIGRVLDSGTEGDLVWTATELLPLEKEPHRARGEASFRRPLQEVAAAALALESAHALGVAHGNVKPSNVLTTAAGVTKVVDFAIVRTLRATEAPRSAYLAPEQVEHGLGDARSDIWALGCVLAERISGVSPFAREGEEATLAAIVNDDPVLPDHLPPALKELLAQVLVKRGARRLSSMLEMRERCLEILDSDAEMSKPSEPPRIGRRSARAAVPASFAVERGNVKGVAIRAGLAWVAETYGAGVIERVRELASPRLAAMLRPTDAAFGVVSTAWYDEHLIGELVGLLEQVAEITDVPKFRDRLGAAIAEDNVHGVYRSLVRLIATPTMLVQHAHRVWGTYCDDAAIHVALPRPGEIHLVFDGWQRHDATVCAIVARAVEHIFASIGYTGATLERTECVGEGKLRCIYEIMYLA